MIDSKLIAVVIPAYNEETQIAMVIEGMPDYVDRIVIVNDCSNDKTSEKVLEFVISGNYPSQTALERKKIIPNRYNEADLFVEERSEQEDFTPSKQLDTGDSKIILLEHLENGGVGAAIATGYKWCKDHDVDCTAVMAGDGQMDPDELLGICEPVIKEDIDYVKGNRLSHKSAKYLIPAKRYIGNSILSIMTKMASGYWRVSDTQTGYTAVSLRALNRIEIGSIYKSYGMPNDMLVKLNLAKCSLKEIEIKPIYRVGEQSKMKIMKLIPRVSWLLLKSFFKRIFTRYFLKDFHPLFLLYVLSFVLFLSSIPFAYNIVGNMMNVGAVTPNSILMIFIFLIISGFQSLLFAMWMDIQDNDRLQK